MDRPRLTWIAVATAAWMAIAGCGGGTTPNGKAPRITSTPPTTAMVGVPFNYTVTADGLTPMLYALSAGPEGMSLDSATGVVTWTPQNEGTDSATIVVSNIAGSDAQSFDVVVEVRRGPVFISTPPMEATVAAEYSYDPEVIAEGAVTWTAPIAPDGLTLDAETGAVRWTPSTAQAGMNSITIRVTETESGAFAEQSFTVTVTDTGGPAVITSMPPDRLYQGETLSYDATASGAPTIVWAVTTPSMGMPAMGVTIGTDPPEGTAVTVEWDTVGTAPGDYSIALEVSNGLGSPNAQEFTVTVDPRPPVPVIDLVTLPPPAIMFVGDPYDYDVNLTPESDSSGIVWSIVEGSTVPTDLAITIDPDTGEVAFTASMSNGEMQYAYGVRATNVLGEADEATITVDAVFPPATPILTVTPATTFTLQVSESFPGASATATGSPDPVLAISGFLPDFLEFDPLTGLLSASSTKPAPEVGDIGGYTFDIVASNSEGTDSATIDVTVIAAPPEVDSITPAAGRRQADVPVIVHGSGFVSSASPTIVLQLGGYIEALTTTFVDDTTLTATVPTDLARPSGVYDVVVDQGSTEALTKRFTVTEGDGSTLSGAVTTNMILTAIDSPYYITGNVQIESGATVTIEPGAVVMFDGGTNRRIDVGVNSAGAIVADGGEPGVGDQIVLTRFQGAGGPAPSGHYRGLRFGANVISAANSLRNVVIEFAGRRDAATDQGAIEVLSGSAPRTHDSLIRESLNYGIYVRGGGGSDTVDWFADNQLTANARSPISIGGNDVSTLGANLDLTGNGEDRVFVRTSSVSRPSASWDDYGVPFFLNQGVVVRNGSVMTLRPGTELRFGSGRRLRVSTATEDGTLIASGTAEAPIQMVPDSGVVGDWDGIHLDDNIGAGTVFRNVRIEEFSGSQSGGLRLDNPDIPGARRAIVENCLIQSSDPGSVGAHLAANARMSSFENNVLDVVSLSVDAVLVGFNDLLRASNTYEAPLQVRASTATGVDLVWVEPVASDTSTQPIRPTGNLTVSTGSLTVGPGVQVQMPLNGQLQMLDSQLVVDGDVTDPVVFAPAPGAAYWNRIRLRGTGGTGVSRISHAVLNTAGSDPTLGANQARAALVVETNGGVPATPMVSNTTVTNSNGYGMVFYDQTHCAGGCDDNTVSGSRFAGLRMFANFIGRFGTGNALAGNNTSSMEGHEGVWVVGDTVDVGALWPANDVPYVVQGNIEVRQATPFDPVPTMTIEPGAELRFAEDRRLRIGEGGDGLLEAQGTVADPIRFTTIDSAMPVYWRGIEFGQGSDGSLIDKAEVSYGGRNVDTGNLSFLSGSLVTVGSVVFTHSNNYAGVAYAGSGPVFVGPPTDRVYTFNGFDCIRDVAAGSCDPL